MQGFDHDLKILWKHSSWKPTFVKSRCVLAAAAAAVAVVVPVGVACFIFFLFLFLLFSCLEEDGADRVWWHIEHGTNLAGEVVSFATSCNHGLLLLWRVSLSRALPWIWVIRVRCVLFCWHASDYWSWCQSLEWGNPHVQWCLGAPGPCLTPCSLRGQKADSCRHGRGV